MQSRRLPQHNPKQQPQALALVYTQNPSLFNLLLPLLAFLGFLWF